MNFQENQFGSISCMVTLMQPKNVVKVANPSAFVVCMHDYKSYCNYFTILLSSQVSSESVSVWNFTGLLTSFGNKAKQLE